MRQKGIHFWKAFEILNNQKNESKGFPTLNFYISKRNVFLPVIILKNCFKSLMIKKRRIIENQQI